MTLTYFILSQKYILGAKFKRHGHLFQINYYPLGLSRAEVMGETLSMLTAGYSATSATLIEFIYGS